MTQIPIIKVSPIDCSHILSLIGDRKGIHQKFNVYGSCKDPLFEVRQICHFLKLKESVYDKLGDYRFIGERTTSNDRPTRIKLTNELGVMKLTYMSDTEFARAFAAFILTVIKQLFLTGNVNLSDGSIKSSESKLLSEYEKRNKEYEKELTKKQLHIDTLTRSIEQISEGYTEILQTNSTLKRETDDYQESSDFYEYNYKCMKDLNDTLKKRLQELGDMSYSVKQMDYAVKQLPTLYIYLDTSKSKIRKNSQKLKSRLKDKLSKKSNIKSSLKSKSKSNKKIKFQFDSSNSSEHSHNENDDRNDDDNENDDNINVNNENGDDNEDEDEDNSVVNRYKISYKKISSSITPVDTVQVPLIDLTKLKLPLDKSVSNKSSFVFLTSKEEIIDSIWNLALQN